MHLTAGYHLYSPGAAGHTEAAEGSRLDNTIIMVDMDYNLDRLAEAINMDYKDILVVEVSIIHSPITVEVHHKGDKAMRIILLAIIMVDILVDLGLLMVAPGFIQTLLISINL